MFDVLHQKVKLVSSMVNLHNLTKFCVNLQKKPYGKYESEERNSQQHI